jgi:hypothetical protein
MVAQVTTNISSRLGVVRVVPDASAICWNPKMDVWDVPEVLAQEHHFTHVLAEFHNLFAKCNKERRCWTSVQLA